MKLLNLTPKKLVTFFLLTTLIPLAAVGSTLILLMARNIAQESRAEGERILGHAQAEIVHQVSLWKNIVHLAAAQPQSDLSFDNLLIEFPEIQSLREVGPDGALRREKKRFGVIRMSPLDLPAIKLRRLWLGNAQIVAEGRPRIPVAAVVLTPSNQLAGFLAADFDVAPVESRLAAFGQDLLIMESNNSIVTTSPRRKPGPSPSTVLQGQVDSLDSGFRRNDGDLISRRLISDLGWTVELRRPWLDVYRPVMRLLVQIAAAVVIVGLVAVLLGWQMSRRVEAAIAHRERLFTIGQMAAVISHEMKTALAVIKNSIEFLKGHMGAGDAKTARHLEIIASQVGASNQILSDILAFSKTSAATAGPCDVNNLLQEVLESLPIPQGIEIMRRLTAGLPPVSVQRGHVKQIAVNLVQNAIQAVDGAGTVSVETGHDAGQVLLRVTDTGCGMPRRLRDKIFEPFFTTKSQGTGLGLAIVKHLVEQNQGRIEVVSAPKNGTTITVWFKPTAAVV